jgi:hypothetical protein
MWRRNLMSTNTRKAAGCWRRRCGRCRRRGWRLPGGAAGGGSGWRRWCRSWRRHAGSRRLGCSQAGGAAAAGAAAAGSGGGRPERLAAREVPRLRRRGRRQEAERRGEREEARRGAHAAREAHGRGGLPPEKPEGYKTDAVIASLKAKLGRQGPGRHEAPEPLVKEFNAWAHKAKLTQAQYDRRSLEPTSAAADDGRPAFDNAMASAQAELVKVWGADGLRPEVSPQMQAAHRAFMTYAPPRFAPPRRWTRSATTRSCCRSSPRSGRKWARTRGRTVRAPRATTREGPDEAPRRTGTRSTRSTRRR